MRRHLLGRIATLVLVAAAGVAVLPPPAVGAVVGQGHPDAVPDSYVVVLRDAAVSSSAVSATAERLAARFGGRVGLTYRHAIRGFSVRMPARAAQRLAADPAVAWIQQDRVIRGDATQPNPPSWGLNRIDQRQAIHTLWNAYTYGSSGSGVRVYVIDTGVFGSHTDFGGRSSGGRDIIVNSSLVTDCHGHGTHVAGTVAGTVYGVAKTTNIVPVRVLDCLGNGTTSWVVAGVDWVTANAVRPAVANMSLGDDVNPAIDTAVTNSINSGITYVVSAGNENADACNHSPARVAAAITVGATDYVDGRSVFTTGASNYGSCLDLFAPGSSITSLRHDSTTGVMARSGTSMAAPHVAGVAATILATNPTWTPAQVRNKLVNDATTGKVTSPGSGSPNRLLFAPPPLTVSISGPSSISVKGTYTYTANLQGFTYTPTYTWSERFCSDGSCSAWSVRTGITTTFNRVLGRDCSGTGDNTFQVKLVVRNSDDGRTVTTIKTTWLCLIP